MKDASSKQPSGGQFEVDLSHPSIFQLWESVQHVMNMASEKMWPLLKLFGGVDGNGLSPFASEIMTTQELLQLMKELFQPPQHDLHGINAADGEVKEEVYANGSNENDNIVENAGGRELSPNVVAVSMKDIARQRLLVKINPTQAFQQKQKSLLPMRMHVTTFRTLWQQNR